MAQHADIDRLLAGVLVTAALVAVTAVAAPGASSTAKVGTAAAVSAPAHAQAPAPAKAPAQARAPAPARPNIVVVMADDMRVNDLRFAPRLRRLAKSGLRFENSFSPFPLCCPARASFLNGQHAHNHQVLDVERPWGYRSFDDSRTLATSLRAVGYDTGFIGKYLNGYGIHRSKVSGRPSLRYVPRGWTDWRAAVENPGGVGMVGGTYQYFNTPFNVDGRIDQSHGGRYQTGVIGDFSVALASEYAARERPFFLYVNYVAPHHGGPDEPDDPRPLIGANGVRYEIVTPARPDWVKGRFDAVVRKPPGLAIRGPVERVAKNKVNELAKLKPMTPEMVRAVTNATRQRAEAVFAMDLQIGRLIDRLKRTGEWRHTYFFVTSDNGYYLGEHYRPQGKTWGHEPSLRVPLLVAGPGLPAGASRYDPITLVDLAATVLDLGDARPPRRPDGRSLLPTMRSGDRGWTTPVLYEALIHSIPRPFVRGWPRGARSAIGVRTARYAYFRYGSGRAELYDLRRDPQQYDNLVRRDLSTPETRAVRRQLDQVWRVVANCSGRSCRAPLPAELQKTPDQAKQLTDLYWAGLRRIYG